MSYNHFYRQLETLARKTFPSLTEMPVVEGLPSVAWDHLISPLEIQLPKSIYSSAEAAIRALWQVSRRPAYVALLEDSGLGTAGCNHNSVLMAYDFHSNEAGDCFLVEVNTNASGFMMASLMERTHEPGGWDSYAPWKALRQAFAQELQLSGNTDGALAITDEDMAEQKMFAEFLMYRDWFKRCGWAAELCDSKQFSYAGGKLRSLTSQTEFSLVYNRMTDFYLQEPTHSNLREAYLAGAATFSPNPREYWLLADKQRLVQLTQPGFLDKAGASTEEKAAINRVLIPTFEKTAFASVDQIWSDRRSLFFKPKRSYGGKSVYRGESVSRKVFERLMAEDILIQKFQPAQRMPTEDPRSVLNNWKFDLRFFVYADQIQLVAARIYQGQVTNFASPMGGFTRVKF